MQATELLDHIDPAGLDYQDWLAVGMALKHEGCAESDWDQWSQRDPARYRPGDCARKWQGFNGASNPVTGGTLAEFAKRAGWRPERRDVAGPGRAFDWDDVVAASPNAPGIDATWVEEAPVEAVQAQGWRQLQMYLSALFEAHDHVGYVCEAWQQEERWLPKKGVYSRTAGELIAELGRLQDIGAALGDYTEAAGAWIRFNPLDGQGVRDANVTAFRYALIESDTLSIEKQRAIYDELELPIVALVNSGKKSLHAIVRIGATTKEEYRERVNFLHQVCNSSGLKIDTQNKNPSRLSRMPGVIRNGVEQSLVGLAQGKPSWEVWKEWIEELNDSLPDIEPLDAIWANLPPLAAPLIENVLRRGHKMLLAGPSKAGKSFVLLQLALAIAEGREWLGWQCAKGRVLYVNLELDRASCLQRLKILYEAKDWRPENLGNIDIWNLRGKAVPMDRLAPKLIRRAQKRGYCAVIVDPIYKVITGDENAADKMAFFCNQFDRLCTELGAAVIYCHHHSKGAQGQKSARDRSSGSGVFARDPDTLLDLIELQIEKPMRTVLENRTICPVIRDYLNEHLEQWDFGQDTEIVAARFLEEAGKVLPLAQKQELLRLVDVALAQVAQVSGWRLEGTLREFAPFVPRNIFFQYPVHRADTDGILEDAKAAGEEAPWAAAQREKRATARDKGLSEKQTLLSAYNALATFSDEPVLIGDLADHMGVPLATLAKQIARNKALVVDRKDNVVRTFEQQRRHELGVAIETAKDLEGNVKLSGVAEALGITEKGARKRVTADGRYAIESGYLKPVEE